MNCKITPQMAAEASKYDSVESFLRAGGLSIETLDKAAFGFTSGDIITLSTSKIKIKWDADLENVLYEIKNSKLSPTNWAKQISLQTPVEVSYLKSKFFLEDGHHRYMAAKILKKELTAIVEIKDKPIEYLSNLSYDDFIRCVWSQSKQIKESHMQNISPSKIIADLKHLTSEFINAAQKVYDNWKQNEEGYDEHYGTGGICDDIADEITSIIRSNLRYDCFTHYDEYEFHTSSYVYCCYEEEVDEDKTEKNAYLISVDIPYYNYESGSAYTWIKKANVKFTSDMIQIHDVSSYADGFIDFETCEPI